MKNNNIIDDKEEQRLIEELEALGIDIELVKLKRVSNIYAAKAIVEGYDFGRELTLQEKRALIQAILNNSMLSKGCNGYLFRLMQRFEQIGLDEQEIYGTIINLGVKGKVLDKIGGFSYTDLLNNKDNACQSIAKYIDQIQKQVSSMIILEALSKGLNEQEEKELIKELETLGINVQFIRLKDISNLYTAKTIVEGYDFGRELTPEEKIALIQSILSVSYLNSKKGVYLARLMQRFEQIGLEEQEIYGAMISLGVNGRVLEETGCSYTDLLTNKDNVFYHIASHSEMVQIRVTEHTIEIAIKKSEKIMQRAVKGQKSKGAIGNHQSKTRDRLGNLVKQEKSSQLEEGQVET